MIISIFKYFYPQTGDLNPIKGWRTIGRVEYKLGYLPFKYLPKDRFHFRQFWRQCSNQLETRNVDDPRETD